jgi:Mrp family chromosome partitioning ATPase/capsular polysaccharide biosynthesis protein
VLTAAVALITVSLSGYSYKATATVLITSLPADPNYLGLGVVVTTGDPTRTVQTAAALLESDQAAASTAAQLGQGWTAAQVQKAITIASVGQTDVLGITGTASSPVQATQLTDKYAITSLEVHGLAVQQSIAVRVAGLQAEIASLPPKSPNTASQSAALSSDLAILEALKTTGTDPTLKISQLARQPTSHSGASRSVILLLGLLGGFALASVAALGIDFFGRRVKDEDELETLFPVPVLASIPKISLPDGDRLPPWMFTPSAFEQVRLLRVQLAMAVQRPVIMITSAGAGDGKTTLVAALAAAFAEGGGDAIVMDLDFRKPSLAGVLGLDPDTQYTAGADGASGVLVPAPGLPRVKLLPVPIGGDPTPDEIIGRLPGLIAQARRAADCVILDTAPVTQVSESLRISTMAESVIFVARPGQTDRELLVRAWDLLARSGAHPAGVVLVGTSTPGGHDAYYSYEPDHVSRPAWRVSGRRLHGGR